MAAKRRKQDMLELLEREAPETHAAVPGDDESREWLSALRAGGPEQEEATARLFELLLRASRFEVNRRRASMPHLRGDDFDDLAHQAVALAG